MVKKFEKGKSGNPAGRPPSASTLARKVNKELTKKGVKYEGNILEYLTEYAGGLAATGQHDKAAQLFLKLAPYFHSKIKNSDGNKEESKDIVISFEENDD
jgi:hypothetical protein